MNTLYNLSPGHSAPIVKLHTTKALHRRLLDIGLTQGTQTTCLFQSPAGDPKAYLIRGTVIALRNEDAKQIEIQ